MDSVFTAHNFVPGATGTYDLVDEKWCICDTKKMQRKRAGYNPLKNQRDKPAVVDSWSASRDCGSAIFTSSPLLVRLDLDRFRTILPLRNDGHLAQRGYALLKGRMGAEQGGQAAQAEEWLHDA